MVNIQVFAAVEGAWRGFGSHDELVETFREFIGDKDASEEAIRSDLDGAIVQLAWLESHGYEEWAWIIYTKGDKVYEINGGHCSCYGFEGQWEPQETDWPTLRHRVTVGKVLDGWRDGSEAEERASIKAHLLQRIEAHLAESK